MAVEYHIFKFEILFVFVLVDESGLQFAFLADIEFLHLDLLGEYDAVLGHSLEDGLFRTPVDRELLVSLLLLEIVDLILRKSLLLDHREVPVKRLDVDAELVIIADDDRHILVSVGDADVGHAVLEVRLSVVVVVEVHLLLEHFIKECPYRQLLPSVALFSVERDFFKFVCRDRYKVSELLFGLRDLPYSDLRLVFKFLS